MKEEQGPLKVHRQKTRAEREEVVFVGNRGAEKQGRVFCLLSTGRSKATETDKDEEEQAPFRNAQACSYLNTLE